MIQKPIRPGMYHLTDEPGYDSDVYYDIHPPLWEYLDGLTPCVDGECVAPHVWIEPD